jgi:hypothetical protein
MKETDHIRNQGFEKTCILKEIITCKDGTGFAESSTERNTVKKKTITFLVYILY